jgi:hypothetical protein
MEIPIRWEMSAGMTHFPFAANTNEEIAKQLLSKL